MESVGIVGAGPAGIAAARWLLHQGFDVVLYERAPEIGGQWTGLPGLSGVWPSLHTNTSRVLTAFSDLEPSSTAVFPAFSEVRDYLQRYAALFGIDHRVRLGTAVERVSREGGRWAVVADGETNLHDRVILASGRFHHPHTPQVDGLDGFTGRLGVVPTYDVEHASDYRGASVVIAGCAVSALEIAADLAQAGAHVTVTQRRQRYVLPKFAAGVPSDHRLFTRYNVLATEQLPPEVVDRQLLDVVLEAGGSPEQYGAPAPAPTLAAAGVTLNQHYLPLVAEGRISVRPWMSGVVGSRVSFADGTSVQADAVILGTGFDLDLSCLDDDVRAVLDVDEVHHDADRWTFHPDLPGLAVLGMWDQSGGYFVPIELQARWVAYAWSGVVPLPEDDVRASVTAYRARRGLPQKTRMNLAAITFARAAGVEPDPEAWPQLRRALLFGPLSPSSFRLQGPDADPDAPRRVAADAAAFGAITSAGLTAREQAMLALLEDAAG
jgi:cation diffusion facilitator CzcD-associated flavoprotein CzcO